MRDSYVIFAILGILSVVAVSGCTSMNTSANTVTIQNNTFTPATMYVQVNKTVSWINKDSVTHRVVSNSGLFDSGNLTTGMSYNYTFTTTGSYSYHDLTNPSMTGTIVVSTNATSTSTNSSGSGIPGY
jgi:plastocyanin